MTHESFVLSIAQALGIPQHYESLESIARAIKEAGTLAQLPTEGPDGWFMTVLNTERRAVDLPLSLDEAVAFIGVYGPTDVPPYWEPFE